MALLLGTSKLTIIIPAGVGQKDFLSVAVFLTVPTLFTTALMSSLAV